MASAPGVSADRYFELLPLFVERCRRLVDDGLPYLAVILCHELYRYLYPAEPYADFRHDDPVPWVTRHLEALLDLADRYESAVAPYPIALDAFVPATADVASLERSTSDLYTQLWQQFDRNTLTAESRDLLARRLPANVLEEIHGAEVLDMGCGSGRYTLALALSGAGSVTGVDVQRRSYASAHDAAAELDLPVEFREGNVLDLPFSDGAFDFVFCNGVLHHSASIERGVQELVRVLRPGGSAFLYLYGAGGIFWETRRALRAVFEKIPLAYTEAMLRMIGMPGNRFIFCDTWYVPVEDFTTTDDVRALLEGAGVEYEKVIGRSEFDLDGALAADVRGAREMWGDGEHRYLLRKPGNAMERD